jgi:hypothetical protein
MERVKAKKTLCDFCGEPYSGQPVPCGALACSNCCEACREQDGFCDEIERTIPCQ